MTDHEFEICLGGGSGGSGGGQSNDGDVGCQRLIMVPCRSSSGHHAPIRCKLQAPPDASEIRNGIVSPSPHPVP